MLHLESNKTMHSLVQTRNSLAEKHLFRKGPGGLHVHEVEHGPAMCPVGKEGQQHSCLPENEY